jgi:hypothetical protein
VTILLQTVRGTSVHNITSCGNARTSVPPYSTPSTSRPCEVTGQPSPGPPPAAAKHEQRQPTKVAFQIIPALNTADLPVRVHPERSGGWRGPSGDSGLATGRGWVAEVGRTEALLMVSDIVMRERQGHLLIGRGRSQRACGALSACCRCGRPRRFVDRRRGHRVGHSAVLQLGEHRQPGGCGSPAPVLTCTYLKLL